MFSGVPPCFRFFLSKKVSQKGFAEWNAGDIFNKNYIKFIQMQNILKKIQLALF